MNQNVFVNFNCQNVFIASNRVLNLYCVLNVRAERERELRLNNTRINKVISVASFKSLTSACQYLNKEVFGEIHLLRREVRHSGQGLASETFSLAIFTASRG